MQIKNYKSLFLTLFAILATSFSSAEAKSSCSKQRECFQHNIQLQLADSNGLLVENTEFWVTLNIIKDGPLVTLELPTINFQTGQISSESPFLINHQLGGFLFTVDGFLPKEVRPTDLVPRSIVAASNNGMSPVFSFTETASELPVPPAGYMVQVSNAGEIRIQAAGTFQNVIAPGPQIMLPCSITYLTKPKQVLCKNTAISNGASNITQFTGGPANDGYRDTHVNDVFNGVAAFAWSDNSMIVDQSNNTLNCMVAVGTVDKNGNLHMQEPVQLTQLPPNVMVWDTSVAISRANPGIIVVSYSILDYSNPDVPSPACRAVSLDGGKTWPAPYEYTYITGFITDNILTVTDVTYGSLAIGDIIYTVEDFTAETGIVPYTEITEFLTGTGGVGTYQVNISQTTDTFGIIASPLLNGIVPINAPYSTGIGDNPGVSADRYGNIVYQTTNFYDQVFNLSNNPLLAVSEDGVFFDIIYTVTPLGDPISQYDFPRFCFGTNEENQYGLYSNVDHDNNVTFNFFPNVGFIPIHGKGISNFDVANSSFEPLPGLQNLLLMPNITVSNDGKIWLQGTPLSSCLSPRTHVYKSPSESLDLNWAGAWDTMVYRNQELITFFTNSGQTSYEVKGYHNNAQTIVYDAKRKALYTCNSTQNPDFSEDCNIYFMISRDNGLTWSQPILVNSSSFANRGYPSMTLDEVTGDLVFGWYDGRNDKTYESVEYFGAVLPAKKLTELVNAIPLSNPTFVTQSAAIPPFLSDNFAAEPMSQARAEAMQKWFKRKNHGK